MTTSYIDPNNVNDYGVSAGQYNKEVQNIANQANILVSLGFPQSVTDAYATNAANQANYANSPYYDSGLSTQGTTVPNTTPSATGTLDSVKSTLASWGGTALDILNPGGAAAGIGVSSGEMGSGNLGSWKNFSLVRISTIFVGLLLVFGAVIMFALNKDDVVAAVKTVAANPEVLA
jgi:hypothetical protein